MDVLLVYPVINCSQDTAYCYGLGYISAVLKQHGHSTQLLGLKNNTDIARLYEKINIERPKVVAFSVVSSQLNYVKKIVQHIKETSDTFVVLGGIHATLQPKCILDVNADVIIRGEYAMLELVQAIEHKIEISNIKNCCFRSNESVIINEMRPLIQDLDLLPLPDKSLDFTNRFIFSRGCVFKCTYCCNKALSNVYDEAQYFRFHSPERSIEMIHEREQTNQFSSIVFDDDTISLNKKWFYDFFALYKKHFKYSFRCNLRVGTVDEDMMKLLKECGADGIGIGIEHGNEKFRKEVLNRNITNEQIIDTFALCDKYNISHNDFIMLGFPFETKQLFFDTVNLCRKVKAKGNISIFHPYPSTDLGILCEKNKWLPDKEFFKEREEAVISYPTFSKNEIQFCHDIFDSLLHKKIFDYFDAAYYINLNRRKDRRDSFEKQCSQVNLPVERFEAIEVTIEEVDKDARRVKFYGKDNERALKYSCALSHYEIIRIAKQKGFKNVLIFEDDCIFSSDFSIIISQLVEELKTIDNKWNMFYLGGNIIERGWIPEQITQHLYRVPGLYGTHAYAINSNCYDYLLSKDKDTLEPVDLSYVQANLFKVTYSRCLAYQSSTFTSDVQSNGKECVFRDDMYNESYRNYFKDIYLNSKFNKTVSCVTRYMDRFEFLKQTLPTWQAYPFDEIIIVDWSSKEDITIYIKSLNDARLKVVRVLGQQYFNQGASWNVGMRYASSDWICGIDCDDILKSDAFFNILPLEENKFYTGLPCTCTHGMVLLSKNAWSKANGFVEIFKTWSQDDVLFYRDLQQVGYERQLSFDSNRVEHINHSDAIRFKNHEIKMSMPEAIQFNIQEESKNKDCLKGMKKYDVEVYKWVGDKFVSENICL
jgi:radical SAM superfamily enzyme YgiQ (UPF0313 family)